MGTYPYLAVLGVLVLLLGLLITMYATPNGRMEGSYIVVIKVEVVTLHRGYPRGIQVAIMCLKRV